MLSKLFHIITFLLLCYSGISAQIDDSKAGVIKEITPSTDNVITNNTDLSTNKDSLFRNAVGPSQNTSSSHPLGLLPNPIIRTDTRYTFDDFIWRKIDSTLGHFHEYNPTQKWDNPHLYLGNIAQNYHSLIFEPNLKPGFQSGFNAYEKYWHKAKNVKYYNTKVPFTLLYYNMGQNQENNAKVVHSQNIGPYYNFAVDYQLYNSKGAYLNQKTLIHNLSMNNWFNTKSRRYALAFAFLFNRVNNLENGGLNFDNLYSKENSGTSRSSVPVHLGSAVNDIKNKGLNLKQIVFLGKEQEVSFNDTIKTDVVQRKYAISYDFNYDKWRYGYNDNQSDNDYYHNFFIDSTSTADTTIFWTIKNSLRWENTPERPNADSNQESYNKIRYFLAIEHDFTKFNNQEVISKWNNLSFSGGITTNQLLSKKFHYGINGKVYVSPKSPGDFSIDGYVRWQINEIMHLKLVLASKHATPDQKQTAYLSNHFVTSNNFNPVFHQKLGFIFRCDHGDIDGELFWQNVQQYIYLNAQDEFVQSTKNLNVLVFKASKAFDWKNFYLYNGIFTQYVADKSQLHLPVFYLKQRMHYKGGFAKGKLTAHLGLDITYHTNYNADAYNPSVREFYYQNSEKLKFYPVMDLYFDILIKKAKVFFLLEHVNQGMFAQKGYYAAPDYGMQDRAFKLGVSWQFYD